MNTRETDREFAAALLSVGATLWNTGGNCTAHGIDLGGDWEILLTEGDDARAATAFPVTGGCYDGDRETIIAAPEIEDADQLRAFVAQARAARAAAASSALNALVAKYDRWNKEQRLTLGSADEHYFDETLTEEQRKWLREFGAEWDAAAKGEA